MKNFFRTVVATFYDPSFYAMARKGTLRKPIWTTLYVGALGVLLFVVALYMQILPFAFTDIVSKVEALYPNDLEIQVAQGEISINQQEPYYIKNTLLPEADMPANLVVFDTIDSLKGGAKNNDTVLLVRKTHIIAMQDKNEERITYLDSKMATTSITKADVTKFADTIRPYVKPVLLFGGIVLGVLGMIFFVPLWLGFHLLYLLFPAALIYLFGRFRDPQYPWRESYVVAVYASIPIAILSFLLVFFSWDLPIFMHTLLVMLVALINLSQMLTSGVPTQTEQTPRE